MSDIYLEELFCHNLPKGGDCCSFWIGCIFAKQQGEVFKFYKMIQNEFLVQNRHMLDTMSQHVGTTFGPCSTGQITAFWNGFSVEDSVRFYCFYLAI